MSFKEIIGQDSAVALLKQVYQAKRLAHAYVFVGPDGVGKRKTALTFTELLVCEDPRKTDEPCGTCPACQKALNLSHADIQWLYPEGQFVKIDAVRQACRRLSLKGFESSAKVLVIPEADALGEESSNALLKTLEEPTSGTLIILIATSLKRILPTIASRCQRIVFSGLKEDVLKSLLEQKFSVPKQEAQYLAGMAEGSLGRALRYRQEALFERKNKLIEEALDPRLRLDEFMDLTGQERAERGERIEEALSVLSSWFRDLLVAKVTRAGVSFINSDRRDDIVRSSEGFSFGELELRMRAIAEARRQMDRNANARISLSKLRVELWNK